jgi:hypothetical protein
MAYVPGCKNDIFVSYAHVDDQRAPEADQGWVRALVEGLKIGLSQILGRRDAFSLWMDYKLEGNTPLTPEILDNLRNSAVVLIILSPGYIRSVWCMREKNAFLETIRNRPAGAFRTFVVECRPLE